jgi:hypothetical protein
MLMELHRMNRDREEPLSFFEWSRLAEIGECVYSLELVLLSCRRCSKNFSKYF